MRKGMSCTEAGRLGAQASAVYQHNKRAERVAEYDKHPKLCAQCGAALSYDKRRNDFCSRSCSITHSNAVRSRKDKGVCKYCGKPLNSGHGKFCSSQCVADYRWSVQRDRIDATGVFDVRFGGEASRRVARRYLVEKFGRRCSICGMTEWMGKPIPLVVDHIDGDATNCAVSNFRLVCGNCDMQLPTYKSKNKYGRAWRRKYNKQPVD